jgi:hypothetical protein
MDENLLRGDGGLFGAAVRVASQVRISGARLLATIVHLSRLWPVSVNSRRGAVVEP